MNDNGANNIPTNVTVTGRCLECGTKTDGFLCTLHTNDLEKLLAELPSLTRDLDITASRQARVDNTIRPTDVPIELMQTELFEARRVTARLRSRDAKIALPATPMPYSRGAADLHPHVVNAATTWTRHIAETRGIALTIAPTRPEGPFHVHCGHVSCEQLRWPRMAEQQALVTQCCTWLVAHIESVRQDEAAAVMLDEVRSLTARIHAVIDRNDPEVFAGRCVEQSIRLYPGPGGTLIPDVRPCSTDLLAGKDEEKVTCPKCSAMYVVAEQRDKMRAEATEKMQRPANISSALTSLETPVKVDTLYKWIERDRDLMEQIRTGERRPPAYPMILESGVDDEGKSIYRVGDVQARVAWVRERSEARKVG